MVSEVTSLVARHWDPGTGNISTFIEGAWLGTDGARKVVSEEDALEGLEVWPALQCH